MNSPTEPHEVQAKDLIEWYYQQGYSDGLPLVPPTPAKIDAMVKALGGDPSFRECRIPPRWGSLTREYGNGGLSARICGDRARSHARTVRSGV